VDLAQIALCRTDDALACDSSDESGYQPSEQAGGSILAPSTPADPTESATTPPCKQKILQNEHIFH
jgi:hypothetical protein